MAAAVLARLPELTLHSNHHRRWRSWLDRSVAVAAPYAKCVVAVDEQWLVHCFCGARHFLGLPNKRVTVVRARVRADSALDAILGGFHSGHGTYWRLALMESVFFAVSISFLLLSFLTIFLIIREILPTMSPEEQNVLRNYWMAPTGFRTLRHRDRAIRDAWNAHVRLFPESRKRMIFASFLIASVISAMGYPLWLTFGPR